MNLKEKHEKLLYPVVRVKTEKVGGSGTVIYSEPDPNNEKVHLTFILTCAHVIEDAITTVKEWDSMLKRDIKKEHRKQVGVEIFDYVDDSYVVSSNSHRADIIAYDKLHDIAILKLESPKKVDYVATLIPRDECRKLIKVFQPIYACGCSLLHDPIPSTGEISYVKEMIENRKYVMGTADTIFGNSGGAIYLAENGYQIGITARITGIQIGFGVDIMTFMGFSVSPDRMYEFFDEQELKFLYDPKDTYEKAMERRKKKEEAMKTRMLQADTRGEETEEE